MQNYNIIQLIKCIIACIFLSFYVAETDIERIKGNAVI